MPSARRSPDSDDVIFELERDKDAQREKGPKAKGSSKVKDLSHVPCKFYKVGSCTAGPACPFSHTAHEPGQKDVCAWYTKGNCKFGHKCALAHILPGQPMTMDRKNKKAAQQATQAANSGNKEGGSVNGSGSSNNKNARGAKSRDASAKAGPRNPLLAGGTAPTRVLGGSSSSSSNPLKAAVSPSQPAPPLKDIDFAALGLSEVANKLQSAPSHGRSPTTPPAEDPPMLHETAIGITTSISSATPSSTGAKSPPSPLPIHTPSAPVRRLVATPGSPGDFGPIGSPPRAPASRAQPTRIDGFLPAESPPTAESAFLSSSPFSAPTSKPVFPGFETSSSLDDFRSRSGIAASLGARQYMSEKLPAPVPRMSSGPTRLPAEAVGEEDLEEFLPGSLTDLLTPEERTRRMSRNNTNKSGVPFQRPTIENLHHKHSRSFPANSLLGDIKAIWGDSEGGGQGSGGVPSSFKSSSSLGGGLNIGEDSFSPSMLAPSNASAAFLPGLRHHYLHAKSATQRSVSHTQYGGNVQHEMASGLPGSVPLGGLTAQLGGDFSHQQGPPGLEAFHRPGRPIHVDYTALEMEEQLAAVSPSARALQAHAPGQSLPQGLAAGYSRIHALPPPPSIPSPASAQFNIGSVNSVRDWTSTSPGLGSIPNLGGAGPVAHSNTSHSYQVGGAGTASDAGDLSTMFSRLSYSAVATRGNPSAGSAPMGMGARNPSARSYTGAPGLGSPLSGPVLTSDEDVLFNFE